MHFKSLFILFLFLTFNISAQQKTNKTLSPEAKRYWNNAMIYKEEAKTFSENELVINELEKLVAIQDYPEAYFELGKLYGKGYISSWIDRSQECFKKYVKLCPDKKDIAEEESNKCETFRNIRKIRFNKNLVGKWVTAPEIKFGGNTYCFEVNSNGTVTVPYEYSAYLERVTDWQTINFGYWPDYGKYILNTGNSIHAESFRVKFIGSENISNLYIHICFFYQENDENLSENKLVGYINHAWNNSSWIWNENHKVIFYKIQ